MSALSKKFPSQSVAFELGAHMKVVEASPPFRFFVEQYTYKANEFLPDLGQSHVTAINTWSQKPFLPEPFPFPSNLFVQICFGQDAAIGATPAFGVQGGYAPMVRQNCGSENDVIHIKTLTYCTFG
jgi:hypothetical protein